MEESQASLPYDSPCRDGLWNNWSNSSKGQPLKDYIESSNKGCDTCRFLLEALGHVKPERLKISPHVSADRLVTFKSKERLDNAGPFKGNEIVLSEGGEQIGSYQFYLPAGDHNLCGSHQPDNHPISSNPEAQCFLGNSLSISESSNSNAALGRMKSWLEYCLAEDEGCKVQNVDFIPKRLLDVGPSRKPNVLLVELQKPVQYVSLSYCWGIDLVDIVTTTTSNISSHMKEGITLQSLSKTIQDAILVCRGTEIQYLWVDALCIIQDDGNDWAKESANMLNIYASSTFTIAVSEPDSCIKGFLGPQKYGSSTWQRVVRTSVPAVLGGPSDHIYIRESNPADTLDNSSPTPRSSLDKRSWCMQESILPNRVLHFDGNELVWQCLQRRLCECGHTVNLVYSTHSELKVGLEHGKVLHMSFAPFNLYQSWYDLVHEYSLRHVTRQTDKLVAISGLATLFSRTTHGHSNSVPGAARFARVSRIPNNLNDVDANPGDYCAGIWKNRFIQGLSWNVDRSSLESAGRLRHARQEQYCAPTWSWASIDGPIEYLYESSVETWKYEPAMKERSQLLEVAFTYMDPANHLSPVTSGYAVLNGPIVPVLIDHKPTSASNPWLRSLFPRAEGIIFVKTKHTSTVKVTVDVDVDVDEAVSGRSSDKEAQTSRTATSGLDFSNTPYYCLELFLWVDARGEPKTRRYYDQRMPPEIFFLLLKKTSINSDTIDVFERLGVGIIKTRHGGADFFGNAMVKKIKLV